MKTPDQRMSELEMLIPGTEMYVPFPVSGWDFNVFVKHPEAPFEKAKDLAAGFFLEQKVLPLMGLLFARARLVPGRAVEDVVWACTLRNVNPQSKQMLSTYVRGLVAPMQVQAVCWISEMWTPKEPVEMGSPEDKALHAWNAKHGTFEGFPGIVECLFAQVETRQRMYQARAAIQRDRKGEPSLGPWIDPGYAVHGGLLAGMFHDLTTVGA